MGNESLKHVLDRLEEVLDRVKRKYNLRVSLSRFISVLSEYPCPARCLQELTPNGEADTIDYFYIERHRYLVTAFVNRLICELWRRQLNAEIICESKERTGRGDVDVRPGSNPAMKIRVEIKGGSSIGIEQIFRYIADASVLVLCLPSRGEAIAINRSQLSSQAYYYLETVAQKAEILLNGGADIKVPGPWCLDCRVNCEFFRKNKDNSRNWKRGSSPELLEEFLKSSKNWEKSINKAVKLVTDLIDKAEKMSSKTKPQTTEFQEKPNGGGE